MKHSTILSLLTAAFVVGTISTASSQSTDAIAAPGETTVATLHAEGAQIYECKAANDGKPIWQFREPIATLLLDGKTVGRHYAGPSWECTDGSAGSVVVAVNRSGSVVRGAGNAAGVSAAWLNVGAPRRADAGVPGAAAAPAGAAAGTDASPDGVEAAAGLRRVRSAA